MFQVIQHVIQDLLHLLDRVVNVPLESLFHLLYRIALYLLQIEPLYRLHTVFQFIDVRDQVPGYRLCMSEFCLVHLWFPFC